ncbi:MAG: phosphatidylglycerophosphatase A [Chlorobiaceae bacterium]|jgi:phosphatidylglycerophosphatase A|nr:phosphatidylglycerophosphatase A [Chlorobiaceae bacterium]
MKLTVAKIVSTCSGIGFFPVAPGTVTSAAAVALYLLLPGIRDVPVMLILILLSSAAGIWSGYVMEEQFGNDPSIVTIDELAGQWIALVAIPAGALPLALSFAFFRFFDIAKPGPVNSAQNLPGGWGIMADDILAGLFANLSVRGVLFLLPLFHLPSGL